MSEFLSQDDIDALLQSGFGDDDGGGGGDDSAGGNGFLPDAAKDLADQAVVVLNTLTGRDVSIDTGESFIGDEAMVSGKLGPDEYLAMAMPLSGDAQGTVTITMLKPKAAILFDLMIMGDGSAPYNDEVKDGINEIFSQIAGSYATFLRDKISGGCSSDGVTVNDNDGVGMIVAEESILLDISIADIETFQVIATFDDALMNSLRPHYEDSSSGGGMTLDDSGLLSQDEIDSITAAADDMASVGEEIAIPAAPPAMAAAGTPASAPNFGSSHTPKGSVDMLLDIDLDVSIELGRTDISIKRVLELAPGSLVELDRLAGEPVDLMVNNKVVAKGEVVVVDESFGVRIISLVSPEERIKSLR